MFLKKLLAIIKQIKFKQIAFSFNTCHLCGRRLQLKLFNDEMGIRCIGCGATPVTQMIAKVFKNKTSNNHQDLYELSSRGPFVQFLKKQNRKLTLSEYFPDTPSGEYHNAILCQNIESLSFKNECFDVVTSQEVFEHVEDDLKGFKEVLRVLKKSGLFIFTVPIDVNSLTTERTKVINSKRINVLPPEYHSDSLTGVSKVFCYRNYGKDIVERLTSVGFDQCEIIMPDKGDFFNYGRPVICAKKCCH